MVACGGSSSSGTKAAGATPLALTGDQACAAASKNDGGRLNYNAATDPDVFQKEIQPFQAKYPGVKINYSSARPADIVQRVSAEVQARHDLDVDAITGDMPSFAPLFDQNLVADVDWSKLGVPQDLQLSLHGVQNYRTYRIILGLGYNTKNVKPETLPSTWDQLVDPRWAGKVIVDPRGVYLSGLSLAWGKDKSVSWFQSLVRTDKPQVVKGATASLEKVISGEASLTTSSHDAEITEQKQKDAPVGIKYLDVVPSQDYYAVVLKGAKHPEAAACFFSWWASAEGQAQQLKYEFKTDVTSPPDLPAGSKIVAINDPAAATLATDTAGEFAKLLAK